MPMTRSRLCLCLTLLALCSLLLVPSVRWPVYGCLRGEAFYQGMPASWWAEEIEDTYHFLCMHGTNGPVQWRVELPSSWWDKVWEQLMPGSSVPVPKSSRNSLLSGDSAALPVLLALLRNKSAKVRRVAITGLTNQSEGISEVLAALREASKDPDEQVHQEAENARILVEEIEDIIKRDRP